MALFINNVLANFEGSTVYGDNLKSSPGRLSDGIKAVRPSTALKLEGTREMITGYRTVISYSCLLIRKFWNLFKEFNNKMEPCAAGELVESVKLDHADTTGFQFHGVNEGHHFYRSKDAS